MTWTACVLPELNYIPPSHKSTVCLEGLAKRILSEKLANPCFVIPIMYDVYFVYQQHTLFRKCQSSTSSAQNCDINRVTAVHLNVFLQHFCFTGFGLLSKTSKILNFLYKKYSNILETMSKDITISIMFHFMQTTFIRY